MLCSFIVYESVDFYKKIYKKFYCKNSICTFDGIEVRFFVSAFEHAFFESNSRKLADKAKFSYKRANRIYWIKWVLQSNEAEIYIGYNTKTKKYDNNRRVAVCIEEYVVIIEIDRANNKKAKFVTAYIADGANSKGEKAIQLIRSSPKWK